MKWVARTHKPRLRAAIVTGTVAALCAIYCTGILEWTRGAAPWLTPVAVGLCGILVLAMLTTGGLSGLRAFGRERERRTLETLIMVPLPAADLVGPRFASALRPRIVFFAILAGASVAGSLISISHHFTWGCWRYVWIGKLLGSLTGCYALFSVAALGTAIGLQVGLRVRSPGRAIAISMGAMIVLFLLEGLACGLFGPVLIRPYSSPWDFFAAVAVGYVPEWPLPIMLVLATLNLFAARATLARTVRNFQAWARGESIHRSGLLGGTAR